MVIVVLSLAAIYTGVQFHGIHWKSKRHIAMTVLTSGSICQRNTSISVMNVSDEIISCSSMVYRFIAPDP